MSQIRSRCDLLQTSMIRLANNVLKLLLSVMAVALVGPLVAGQTFTVLHSFTGGTDGQNPWAGVVINTGGRIYGTTNGGGSRQGACELYGAGCGVAFELSIRNSSWILTPLYSFHGGTDGAIPQGQLTIGPNGSLYGTTADGGNEGACFGGCGTVFNLRPAQRATASIVGTWGEKQLYLFDGPSGIGPLNGPLIFGATGQIFGTAAYGGPSNAGTVYELVPTQGSWVENTIYTFQGGTDGAQPMSGLWQDAAGNLYGTTYGGGSGFGTVYELIASESGWTKTTLYEFDASNQYPIGGVIMDDSGNLLGTTSGGSGGGASIYELTQSSGQWLLTTLHAYGGSLPNGGPTANLTADSSGNLYGTALEYGTFNRGSVFKLTRINGGWTYIELHSFSGGSNDGQYPYGAVSIDSTRTVYGTSVNGGSGTCTDGCGIVWQIAP